MSLLHGTLTYSRRQDDWARPCSLPLLFFSASKCPSGSFSTCEVGKCLLSLGKKCCCFRCDSVFHGLIYRAILVVVWQQSRAVLRLSWLASFNVRFQLLSDHKVELFCVCTALYWIKLYLFPLSLLFLFIFFGRYSRFYYTTASACCCYDINF